MISVYNLKYPKLKKDLEFKRSLLNNNDKHLISNLRLSKINYTWEYCYNKFSFYKDLKLKYKLPDYLDSLDRLKDFPIINKNLIKKNYSKIKLDSLSKKFTLTGGTSGILLGFPTSYYDEYLNIVRTIYYRQLVHNINIYSRSLYIWGHSHKFGRGLKKMKSQFKATIKDRILNRKRVSAYDLDNLNIEKIIKYIKNNNIEYLITYGSSFEIILDFLSINNIFINQPIKVIVTSDNLSRGHLNKFRNFFLNSSIINEYGMAETGIIGYSDIDFNKIKIFYDDFLVEEDKSKLIISSLNCTSFPLIRYDSEDFLKSKKKFPLETIDNLIGKKRPILEFEIHEKKISSIIFDHILKNIPEIIDFQYSLKNKKFYIYYQSIINLDVIIENKIRSVLKIDMSDKIKLIKRDILVKTISGKKKLVV